MSHDYLIKALSADGFVNICAIDSTKMVEEARRIHNASPTAAAALGRCLTAAAMMGSDLKGSRSSVTLRIKGGGPIGTIICSCGEDGCPRGTVTDFTVDPPRKPSGKLDVGAAVGTDGYLEVIRDVGMREPYAGRVPLVSGEIAEDLTSYYFQSEQSPGVCGLGVLTQNGKVTCAGGYLIRLLPGTPDEVIDELEKCAPLFVPATELLSGGATPEDIISILLPGFDMKILEESRKPVEYRCTCSRDRVTKALVSLGKAELLKFASECEVEPAEINCEFCDKTYVFRAPEIRELAESASRP
ncbi:MAG: Hsp33 family molecular chaperone HslO [Clostridia bacterium]|nr:Hsp33 family molecular chaperone HslO [Oscillospiraceae bacterium]MBQ6990066.1 Hsp33 family molecular chaperone HslO [Clostridia bacterium]MBR6762762.1 Hsp33 family molecular chaperone HslO [Clostridia bacterium]